MDSNIPVVGGSDPTPGTQPNTTPAAEAQPLRPAQPEAPVPASAQPPAEAVDTESEPAAPVNGRADLPTDAPASPESHAAPDSPISEAAPDSSPASHPSAPSLMPDSSNSAEGHDVQEGHESDEAQPIFETLPQEQAQSDSSDSAAESSALSPESEPPEAGESAPTDQPTEQQMLEGAPTGVKKGDILEGTIVSTSPTEILIDIGQKAPGVVQRKELDRMDRAALEQLKPGEKVWVYVVDPEGQSGDPVLSITRAAEEKDWRDAETFRQNKTIYLGKIDGFNKGGLIVRFGRVRGFIPESQVSRERRERAESNDVVDKWGGMRGEEIAVKVLEVDRARNRLILSEREAAPQRREQMKSQLLGQLKVGDVRIGRVKSLSDFGAFVDVGGADGLVHLTEISWKHIAHPQDVLTIGQEVKVEVISIDQDRKRIGLSIKRQEEDPWTTVTKQYAIGDLVQATITKLVKFGAFARLVDNPEVEGLVHITELADHRVNHPRDVVHEDDVLTLRVVKVDSQRRRIGLSLRRVSSPEYVDRDYARATGAPSPVEPIPDFNEPPFQDEDETRRRERRKGRPKGNKRGGGREGGFGEEEEF